MEPSPGHLARPWLKTEKYRKGLCAGPEFSPRNHKESSSCAASGDAVALGQTQADRGSPAPLLPPGSESSCSAEGRRARAAGGGGRGGSGRRPLSIVQPRALRAGTGKPGGRRTCGGKSRRDSEPHGRKPRVGAHTYDPSRLEVEARRSQAKASLSHLGRRCGKQAVDISVIPLPFPTELREAYEKTHLKHPVTADSTEK